MPRGSKKSKKTEPNKSESKNKHNLTEDLEVKTIELEEVPEEDLNINESSSGLDDSVQLYLKTIGKIPLLSADEEIKLAKEIASDSPDKSKRACSKLIQANLRLVVSIAKRYASNSIPLLDLVQEGNTGLMKAAKKFDYELGYRFSTYATWWIKQAITRSINEKEKTIRIPAHVLDQINKLRKTVDKLTREYGRPPSDQELSATLDFSMEDVNLWKEIDNETVSLESPINKEHEGSLSEVISDLEEKTPDVELQHKLLKKDLLKYLNQLDEEEKNILELRFGFNRSEAYHSIEEVSKALEISRDRVRKIEFKALRKLKNIMGAEVKDYLHTF